MFKPELSRATFVCLMDVFKGYTEYNPVIYNIHMTDEENTKVLKEIVNEYFNASISDDEIKKLITLEPWEFVTRFKNLVA